MSEHIKQSKKTLLAALMLASLALGGTANAANEDSRYEACPRCEPKNLVWSAGQFDQVYLVPGASRNAHPRSLNAEPLARLLNRITQSVNGKTLPVLGEDAANELARGLVTAMSKAEAQHDVLFFMSSRGNSGIFANRVGHSGTAFVDEQGLNLIFGEANVDFFTTWKASHIARPFDFGSRTRASKVMLAGEGMAHPRADWIVIPLGTPAAVAPPPPPLTVGGPATTQAVGDTRNYQSVGNAPAAAVAPARVAGPAHGAAPATADRGDAFYQAQETRLKGLKRLREQGLLSEDEYQAKRKEILKDL